MQPGPIGTGESGASHGAAETEPDAGSDVPGYLSVVKSLSRL